jgi:hypothetical protein
MVDRLPEYMRDLIKAVPDDVVRSLVEDFRTYKISPAQDPSAKVTPVGAGKVVDGGEGVRGGNGSGWVEAPRVDSWRPPGIDAIDAMCDAQDARDRVERIRHLAEAAAVRRAEAELLKEEPKPSEKK